MKRAQRLPVAIRLSLCLAWLLPLVPLSPAHAIELAVPIDCEVGRTCFIQNYVDHDRSAGARDYRCGSLVYDGHKGTDFRLPSMAAQRRGVDVLAAAGGRVLRTRDGMADVSIATAGAPSVAHRECGNGIVVAHADGWQTQYCHLARGSVRVKPGDRVAAGQPLGQVGLSGKTEFPHVHMTVRRNGEVVDPFAVDAPQDACGEGTSIWKPGLRASLAYRTRAILNAGFADGPLTMEEVESGRDDALRPQPDAGALVAFVRAIGLRRGDVQRLSLVGPDGQTIVDQTEPPLDHDKAQVLLFAGRKRPASGWRPGDYRADYQVVHDGKTVLERRFEAAL